LKKSGFRKKLQSLLNRNNAKDWGPGA